MSNQYLDSTGDPETMTTEERLDNIASILAVGVYRLQHDSQIKLHGIDRNWRPTQYFKVSSSETLEYPIHADLSVSEEGPDVGPGD